MWFLLSISLIHNILGAPLLNEVECDIEDYFENPLPFAKRNAVVNQESLWPKGIIPYIIDESLDFLTDRIETVMKEYEKLTCIRFKQHTDPEELNYIKIYLGNGCRSMVGRFPLAYQLISLGLGCHSFGTITHEIGHTVGLHHEHNRSDRDDYLEILWDNIKPNRKNQFQKLLPNENLLINEFDYTSVMMYGDTTFSKDGILKTMKAKRRGIKLKRVSEKSGLSKSDIERINVMYNCTKI